MEKLKPWEKPTLLLLSDSVQSGFFISGAERVLTCGGSVTVTPDTILTPNDCITNNPDGPYNCSNVDFTLSNGVFGFVTVNAADTTIANSPCS